MASYAPSPFSQGQHVQVNVEGLLDLGDWAGRAAGVSGRVTAVDPVSKMVTVVFDQPVGGQHSLTVAPNRVRRPN